MIVSSSFDWISGSIVLDNLPLSESFGKADQTVYCEGLNAIQEFSCSRHQQKINQIDNFNTMIGIRINLGFYALHWKKKHVCPLRYNLTQLWTEPDNPSHFSSWSRKFYAPVNQKLLSDQPFFFFKETSKTKMLGAVINVMLNYV